MNNNRRFDPNNDRLARDIRNTLSRALMTGLDRLDISPADELAAQYLYQPLAPLYHDYVRARLSRYREAVTELAERRLFDPFEQSLVLWNLGLFFEVHERLESLWIKTTGRRKQALQALIRAAGVYVHLENGRQTSAASMALKAVTGLENFSDALPELAGLKTLIESLKRLDTVPPRLV